MDVVPFTLTISLCLTFSFIIFFICEQRRRRVASLESESLLPLLREETRTVQADAAQVSKE